MRRRVLAACVTLALAVGLRLAARAGRGAETARSGRRR